MTSPGGTVPVLPRAAVWLVWAVSGVGVTLGVLALVFGTLHYSTLDAVVIGVAPQAMWAISFPVVGAVIATHRPRNPLGWIFLAVGLLQGLVVFGYEYASYGFQTAPGTVPGGGLAVWIAQWAWAPGLGLALTFVPLLFPDGRLPSPRWRPVAWLAAISIAVIAILTAVVLWPWRGPALLTPDTLPDTSGYDAVFFPAYGLMLGCGVASLTALVLRFRRARGIERQQLKWLLFACAVTITIVLVVQPGTTNQWELGMLLALPFFPSVPVGAGIAILRYRLYEIDRIINRTLVYGLVTAILALCYGGLVLALGQLFGTVGERTPSWAVAGATLATAALFQPARRRIQAAVDRRFYRRRYHAARTIEAFSARLRDQVDLDSLSAELVAVADHTMEPTMLSLWLRPPLERSQPSRR
jgi:hypothetical protein